MKKRENQLPMIGSYESSGIRHDLLAETPLGEVSINHDFIEHVQYYPGNDLYQTSHAGQTPFNEIKIADPSWTQTTLSYAENKDWQLGEVDLGMHFGVIIPETDIFFHSSGWDVRLIDHALDQWEGKKQPVFVCWEPESEYFKLIMEYMGVKNYLVYKEGEKIDYRKELVAFDDAWRYVNGFYKPWCVAGPCIDWLVGQGLVAKEPTVLMGLFANEFGGMAEWLRKRGLKQRVYKLLVSKRYPNPLIDRMVQKFYFARDYTAIYSARDLFLPYADIVAASNIPADREKYLWEKNEDLAKFEQMPQSWLNQYPYWHGADQRISDITRAGCLSRFNSSWYAGKEGKVDYVPRDLSEEWWREYVLASICEQMIKRGVEIKW